jgi:predicted negative regulator of RcsB-dependent stress response
LSAYADQEELDKLKDWWKNYGHALIAGVLLGAAILVGVRYWTQHKEQSLQAASVIYEQMIENYRAKKPDLVRHSGESLINDYASTPYAGIAALILARMDFDSGDMVGARKRLQWTLENADDAATVHAARLRLARLHLSGGDKDAALALLDVKDQAGFKTEYEELKGDIYTAQGKNQEARAAFGEALKRLPAGSPYAPVLNMKLDDLGPEQKP